MLYTMLPMTYLTGSYRLIDFKNFPFEIGAGLVLEFFGFALPTLFAQAINNATLHQQQYRETGLLLLLNDVQSLAMACKLVLICDLVLEIVMYIYEMIKLHQLERRGLQNIGRYSERQRRQIFARVYARNTLCWLVLIVANLLLVLHFVDPAACLAG